MSNKNQPHHKFVQTFILATQPNGYYVLNDIFRYLNEDEDEVIDDTPAPAAETAASSTHETVEESEPVPTPAVADEVVNTEAAASKVDEELEEVAKDTSSTEEVNGEEPEEETVAEEAEEAEETQPEPDIEEPAPTPEVKETEKESTPEPVAEAAAPAPKSDGPPVKKTWASLVSSSKTAQAPVVPQTQTQAPAATTLQPKSQAQKPAQQSSTAKQSETPSETADTPTSQSNGWQEAGKKPKQSNKASEGIVHAYIKNVNDKTDARLLRDVLEKFGKLKYFDVSRPKVCSTQASPLNANNHQQCAFVEFEDSASYAAAVAENPHTVGSESINVEERRPRPGTAGGFNNFTPRGGATAGRGRGGNLSQRTGSSGGTFNGTGRGGSTQTRGAKTGTSTRGRGQSTT